MSRLSYLILFFVVAGCEQSVCTITWWKLSDAQITFSARGQQFIAGDSTDGGCGIAGVRTLGASYNPDDSMFFISGSAYNASIEFEFRGPLQSGNFVLDEPIVFPPDSSRCAALHGGASVVLSNSSAGESKWITDSVHTGFLRITSVDSVNHVYNASFSFTGIDNSDGNSLLDTVHVYNGLITKMLE